MHGFALQAVGTQGWTINELGQRLGVSKQVAAKTASTLESSGYFTREPVPSDRSAVMLRRTPRAEELLAASAAGFERVMDRGWEPPRGDRRRGDSLGRCARVARCHQGGPLDETWTGAGLARWRPRPFLPVRRPT